MKKNKYIGSSCDCMNMTSNDECDHGTTIGDTHFLLKFFEFINANGALTPEDKRYKRI